jgi:micrococcal nuclease
MRIRHLLIITVLSLVPALALAQRVVSVIDGDSFQADFGVFIQQVRMIGIECPEATPSAKARREARRMGISMERYLDIGKAATAFVRRVLPRGLHLRLEFDRDRRDKYGRVLAYVFLPNGKLLNEELVALGYARLFPTQENTQYQRRLRAALARAQQDKRGLWSRR